MGKEIDLSSILKSANNARVLPTEDNRFIRTDCPTKITDEEIQWLKANNTTTLVDLRTLEEANERPCRLEGMKGFTYYHYPVTGGGSTPKSRTHLLEVYAGMIDEQMERIVNTILNASTNVMYFCTAGKDRTGVVSAILLKRLGYDRDIVVDDYMKSKDNLLDMLTTYVKEHPDVDLDVIIPHRSTIMEIWDML